MVICNLCSKTASYNLKGLKPKFCKDHKTTEMIDLMHKKCDVVIQDLLIILKMKLHQDFVWSID